MLSTSLAFSCLISLAFSQCAPAVDAKPPSGLLEARKAAIQDPQNNQIIQAYAWTANDEIKQQPFVPCYSSVPKPDPRTGEAQGVTVRVGNPTPFKLFIRIHCDNDAYYQYDCEPNSQDSTFRPRPIDSGQKCVDVIQVFWKQNR